MGSIAVQMPVLFLCLGCFKMRQKLYLLEVWHVVFSCADIAVVDDTVFPSVHSV